MEQSAVDFTIAGLDGCAAGWVLVLRNPQSGAWRMQPISQIADLISAYPGLAAIAVDMPIGLPDAISGPGRAAEQAVRPLLGARQSSVFSIPVRAAVEAPDYGAACALALAASNPPRKVSKQGFMIFPKIREIDALLRAHPGLCERLIETHPEVVFRRLKGAPLEHPKKTEAGFTERASLLERAGIAADLIAAPPPRGAKRDDLLDAIACSLTAERHALGEAQPNPDPFLRDRHGFPIAIWA
jgi:threonine dehydratase